MHQFVSIIIPTYREWHLLEKCIRALVNQSYPQESFEVLVVNNDPADAPPKDFYWPSNFTLLSEAKPGSYAARNAALKQAKGEILGFTDSDCIPDKDWIQNAVAYFAQHKDCTRIAGDILILQSSASPSIMEVYNKLYSFPQQAVIKNHGGSMTANLFTYRHVIDKVGGFNDSLMSYGDLEWGSRAHKAGYKIHYVRSVKVHHPARNLQELIKKEKRLGGGVAMTHKSRRGNMVKVLKFLYQFRPRTRAVRYMMDSHKELRLKDMVAIPFIRYYFGLIRSFEVLRIQLGKSPNRS